MLNLWQGRDDVPLSRHTVSETRDLCFSSDNRSVVIATKDRRVLEIIFAQGESRVLFTVPETDLYTVRYDPTARYVATGGYNKRVFLWDREEGEQVAQFTVPGQVYCLGFSPDGKMLASATIDIRLFDVETRQHCLSFGNVPDRSNPDERLRYSCLTFSAENDWLVAAHGVPGGSSMLRMWDTANEMSAAPDDRNEEKMPKQVKTQPLRLTPEPVN